MATKLETQIAPVISQVRFIMERGTNLLYSKDYPGDTNLVELKNGKLYEFTLFDTVTQSISFVSGGYTYFLNAGVTTLIQWDGQGSAIPWSWIAGGGVAIAIAIALMSKRK